MTKDRDELYGLHLRGTDRPMPFVNPYRTKGELNDIEQWKLERHPLEIADAIIDTYSKEGPAGIAKIPGEVERLKWAGIYPQKQGGDAFMMRVKVPGGVLTADQAREIGVAADAFGEGPEDSAVFGNRYADITTRQTVQIHWLRIEDIPRIWRRFAAVGLTTVQACGDSARNVLCCPVSGVDGEEVLDALPVARATGRASKASWASTPETGQLKTLRAESPHACTVVRPTAANRRQIRGMSSMRNQWICTVWRVVRSA